MEIGSHFLFLRVSASPRLPFCHPLRLRVLESPRLFPEAGTSEQHGFVEFPLQFSLGQNLGPIGRDPDAALFQVEKFYRLVFLSGAENEADRRVLSRLALVFVQPAQVEFHLALVTELEVPQLEINRHQSPQSTMVEGRSR